MLCLKRSMHEVSRTELMGCGANSDNELRRWWILSTGMVFPLEKNYIASVLQWLVGQTAIEPKLR